MDLPDPDANPPQGAPGPSARTAAARPGSGDDPGTTTTSRPATGPGASPEADSTSGADSAPEPDAAETGWPQPEVLSLAVSAVARRLGVAPATLRTWDRRYGLGPATRTTGSHRRYGEADLARLDLMRRLVNSGMAPADAARTALAADAATLPAITFDLAPLSGAPVRTLPADYPPASAQLTGGGWDRPEPWPGTTTSIGANRSAGESGLLALPGLSPVARGLGRAALALDGPACIDVILDAVGRHGVVWSWEQVLVPVLVSIGRRWQDTGEGIEVEHLASESIKAAMTGVAMRLRAPVNARPVLLACTDGETHSLPLFVAAAALSERRVSARVLGARVPHEALLAAIRRAGPAAVLVWAQVVEAQRAVLGGLCTVRPTPLVLTAGPGWTGPVPPGVVQVHDLADAVRHIASTVH